MPGVPESVAAARPADRVLALVQAEYERLYGGPPPPGCAEALLPLVPRMGVRRSAEMIRDIETLMKILLDAHREKPFEKVDMMGE